MYTQRPEGELGVFLSHFQPYFLRQGPSLNLGITEELH